MSVSSQIKRINDNISNAYDAVESKEGTLPTEKNSDNLASAIESINTGKVDDVTVDGTSVVENKVAKIDLTGKQDTLEFNTAYDKDTNKAATMKDITDAITTVINADY